MRKPLEGLAGRNPLRARRVSRTADKPTVIDDLDLTSAPGEKIGLVGRSGAGKSHRRQPAAALPRPRDRPHPDRRPGHRARDAGKPARADRHGHAGHVAAASLACATTSSMAAPTRPMPRSVPQPRAPKRTISSTALTDLQGRTRLRCACRASAGSSCRGGQRQRVAIARVMLKDAPILLLDEATSALDSRSGGSDPAEPGRLMRGKTVVAIAHRLSTIAAMDRLIVLDGAASSRKAITEPARQERSLRAAVGAPERRLPRRGMSGQKKAAPEGAEIQPWTQSSSGSVRRACLAAPRSRPSACRRPGSSLLVRAARAFLSACLPCPGCSRDRIGGPSERC